MALIGLRKLIAFFAATVAATVLVYLGKIESGTYEVIMIGALGGYFTANVTSKWSKKDKEEKTNG